MITLADLTDNTALLSFGYNRGLPPNVRFAWGARLIVTQDGYVDFVPDRTDVFSRSKDQGTTSLVKLGKDVPPKKWITTLGHLLTRGDINTREDHEWTLHREEFVVKANTQASAGYCYICAYAARDEPAIWSADEAGAAEVEGWNLFQTDGIEHSILELEKVDFPDADLGNGEGVARFKTDADAWEHVWRGARANNPLHLRALTVLKWESPVEFQEICTWTAEHVRSIR
jgi:hypothetical protein